MVHCCSEIMFIKKSICDVVTILAIFFFGQIIKMCRFLDGLEIDCTEGFIYNLLELQSFVCIQNRPLDLIWLYASFINSTNSSLVWAIGCSSVIINS